MSAILPARETHGVGPEGGRDGPEESCSSTPSRTVRGRKMSLAVRRGEGGATARFDDATRERPILIAAWSGVAHTPACAARRSSPRRNRTRGSQPAKPRPRGGRGALQLPDLIFQSRRGSDRRRNVWRPTVIARPGKEVEIFRSAKMRWRRKAIICTSIVENRQLRCEAGK